MPRDDFEGLEKVEEISKVSSTKKSSEIDSPVVERVAPDKELFDQMMGKPGQAAAAGDTEKARFMDEVRELQKKVEGLAKVSPDTLIHQSQSTIGQIEEVKKKLAASKDELQDPSVQEVLSNKLEHIDEHLKAALNRTGSEYIPLASTQKTENPIERFLGFLTHGQYQLQKIADEVHNMHLNKNEISPANMLVIQLKMGYVQQEIEFFTAVLNKSLESTKTVMNVQV
jgi:hypothetical protein